MINLDILDQIILSKVDTYDARTLGRREAKPLVVLFYELRNIISSTLAAYFPLNSNSGEIFLAYKSASAPGNDEEAKLEFFSREIFAPLGLTLAEKAELIKLFDNLCIDVVPLAVEYSANFYHMSFVGVADLLRQTEIRGGETYRYFGHYCNRGPIIGDLRPEDGMKKIYVNSDAVRVYPAN